MRAASHACGHAQVRNLPKHLRRTIINPTMNLFDHTRVILERDPAATSRLMVLTCYPGLQAVWVPPRRPGRTS
ncbi:hypothetical protein [Granulicella sp. L46]|uniref:hypothetical protein n=1 Tax=Granulicella sp. L46 TaxID=1641865 RepID=UPI001C20A3C0|nr:hypothetical protein [Granulicella sp. L46]